MTITEILRHKGAHVFSVSPTDTIAEVVETLGDRSIGAVLVRDSGGQLLGIVSERDIVRCLRRHGAGTLGMTAGQLMTQELTTASPRTTVAEARRLMTEGRFRHLPILEDGALVGLVSIGDVVKARISEAEEEVGSLRAFIAGDA
jgi:CBS domain-containing protein